MGGLRKRAVSSARADVLRFFSCEVRMRRSARVLVGAFVWKEEEVVVECVAGQRGGVGGWRWGGTPLSLYVPSLKAV